MDFLTLGNVHQVPLKSVHCMKSYWEKQTQSDLKLCVFCTQKSCGIPTLIVSRQETEEAKLKINTLTTYLTAYSKQFDVWQIFITYFITLTIHQ